MKYKFSYKVCNVTSEWIKEPFAVILIDEFPLGAPLSLPEAEKIVSWLQTVTDWEADNKGWDYK